MPKNYYTNPDGETLEWETPDIVTPLDNLGALATLLAVVGAVTVQDAANAVNLTPEDLINEAQAWAAAEVVDEG